MDKAGMVVVTGGGGFIGAHMVRSFQEQGFERIRAVDVKPLDEWYQTTDGVENLRLDLRDKAACFEAAAGAQYIFNLAADMGGMGFIESNKALCMLTVPDQHAHADGGTRERRRALLLLVVGVRLHGRQADHGRRDRRCGRPTPTRRCRRTATAGRSCSANACAGTSPRTSGSDTRSRGTTTSTVRTARTTAAARRRRRRSAARSSHAKLSGKHEIEIWGDGEQTRSFMYIDDCLKGTQLHHGQRHRRAAEPRQRRARHDQPARRHRRRHRGREARSGRYKLDAPKGVRGRNSDNTLIKERLGWEPSIPLRVGLEHTYRWIHDELTAGVPV